VRRGVLLGADAQKVFLGIVYSNYETNIEKVKDAPAKGFKIYVCHTASRGLRIKQSHLIDGIQFTPGGYLMVADK